MYWQDERYVKLYTRDTTAWLMMRWEARACLPLIMRKLDRIGAIDLGDDGVEGLAEVIKMPVTVVRDGLADLIKRGSFVMRGTVLVMPNYMDAQDVPKSDAERAKAYRERKRQELLEKSKGLTTEDAGAASRSVTSVRDASQNVTPSLAEPSLAEPSRAGGESAAGAPAPTPAVLTNPEGVPKAKRKARTKKPLVPMPDGWEPRPGLLAELSVRFGVDASVGLENMRSWVRRRRLKDEEPKFTDWDMRLALWVEQDAKDGKLPPWEPPMSSGPLRGPDMSPEAEAMRAEAGRLAASMARKPLPPAGEPLPPDQPPITLADVNRTLDELMAGKVL